MYREKQNTSICNDYKQKHVHRGKTLQKHMNQTQKDESYAITTSM